MSGVPKIAGQVSFHLQYHIAETFFFFKATCPFELLTIFEYWDYDILEYVAIHCVR